jgi:hypothetical protein
MAEWLRTDRDFVEADVVRWTEAVFKPRRNKGKAVKIGERFVVAEVLREQDGWVHLLDRQRKFVSARGVLERQIPIFQVGTEIKRKRGTVSHLSTRYPKP